MDLTAEEYKSLADRGFFFIGLILPILMFGILRRCFPNGNRGAHEKAAVLAVWVLLAAYMFWTTPIRIAYHENLEAPNSDTSGMYDGTGANSFTVVFGWILPLISLLVFIGLVSLTRYVRRFFKRRHRNPIL